jgi:hypothetical protein
MEKFMNGTTECIVLERKNGLSLILCPENPCTPYIIVWGWEKGKTDWAGGKYFSDLKDAVTIFRKGRFN